MKRRRGAVEWYSYLVCWDKIISSFRSRLLGGLSGPNVSSSFLSPAGEWECSGGWGSCFDSSWAPCSSGSRDSSWFVPWETCQNCYSWPRLLSDGLVSFAWSYCLVGREGSCWPYKVGSRWKIDGAEGVASSEEEVCAWWSKGFDQ